MDILCIRIFFLSIIVIIIAKSYLLFYFQVRCEEVGLYKFHGNSSMHCVDGLWDAVMPHCEATTLHKNFSREL
jgi:hypothetical protein